MKISTIAKKNKEKAGEIFISTEKIYVVNFVHPPCAPNAYFVFDLQNKKKIKIIFMRIGLENGLLDA